MKKLWLDKFIEKFENDPDFMFEELLCNLEEAVFKFKIKDGSLNKRMFKLLRKINLN